MKRKQEAAMDPVKGSRKGIYLLPNLLTSASLFSGFYALIAAINGQYPYAATAILVAAVFDGLDGRVARLTNTTSRFGVEYDSLSDLVAFGVAPGILAFMWSLQGYGRMGWLAAFLYVATTALRLARFNVLSQSGTKENKSYFYGLPCPSAAAAIATAVLLCHHLGIRGEVRHISVLLMVYGLSFLMVSTVRYFSFKDVRWFQRHPFSAMVALILAMTVIAMQPTVLLFGLIFTYVLSGPVFMSWRVLWPRRGAAQEGSAGGALRGGEKH